MLTLCSTEPITLCSNALYRTKICFWCCLNIIYDFQHSFCLLRNFSYHVFQYHFDFITHYSRTNQISQSISGYFFFCLYFLKQNLPINWYRVNWNFYLITNDIIYQGLINFECQYLSRS